MCKKLVFLVCGIVLFLGFYGCTLPSSIEITGTPEVSLPVDRGDLSALLSDAVQDALSDNDLDVTVLQYTGNMVNGREVKTFLIQYNVFTDQLDFLNDLSDAMDDFVLDFDFSGMSIEIELGDLSGLGDSIDPIYIQIDFMEILEDVLENIDEELVDQKTAIDIAIGLPSDTSHFPPSLLDLIELEVDEEFELDGFETVTFAGGSISIDVWLSDSAQVYLPYMQPASVGADARIIFTDVVITDCLVACGGNPPCGNCTRIYGNQGAPIVVEGVARTTVTFELDGVTLRNKFHFTMGEFIDETPRTLTSARFVSFNVEPNEIVNPLIRGVTGFEMEDPIELEIPGTRIPIDVGSSGFVHAEIGGGLFDIDINILRTPVTGSSFSWVDADFDISIFISQDYILDSDAPDGIRWHGLSFGHPGNIWEFDLISGATDNLANKSINTSDVIIHDTSNVVISSPVVSGNPTGISFWLGEDDVEEGKLTIIVTPTLRIDSLNVIHVDAGNFIQLPEIPSVQLGDAADFLKQIHFPEISVSVEFGYIDIEGLEIMFSVPGFINDNRDFESIVPFISSQTVSIIDEKDVTFQVQDIDGTVLKREIDFEFAIKLNGTEINDNTRIIAITNFDFSRDSLRFEVKDVDVTFDWSEIVVNLNSVDDFSGSFPETNHAPIDLSQITDIISGFTFNGIQAYLYVSGPDRFFNLSPGIDLQVILDDGNGPNIDLFGNEGFVLTSSSPLNLDPGSTGKFSGNLPSGGIAIGLADVLNAHPSNLRFEYDLDGLITVTPSMLVREEGELEELNVAIVMVLPLSLTAGANAALVFTDEFNEGEDFLDRSLDDDSSLLDVINSLTLNVTLTDEVFSGGTLYMRREGETAGNELLRFELSGRTISLPITGEMLESINNINPFIIEEIGIRFNEGSRVEVPNNLGAVRIDFTVDFRYRIEL